MDIVNRFIKYVMIETTSDRNSTTVPSSDGQLILAKLLKDELLALGVEDAYVSEYGVVYGHLKANIENAPKIGLIAHMDTSEDMSGKKDDAAATMLYPTSCKIATDKFEGVEDGENRTRLFRDDYLIRLPETILLRAEIKWRLGDNAGAASDINMLRSRAQCGYLVTANDVSLELILDERARELVYEESRWNTLLRMGGTIAVERIKEYSYWDYPRTTLTENYNLWPIPQTVIDTNKDVDIEQNPGW